MHFSIVSNHVTLSLFCLPSTVLDPMRILSDFFWVTFVLIATKIREPETMTSCSEYLNANWDRHHWLQCSLYTQNSFQCLFPLLLRYTHNKYSLRLSWRCFFLYFYRKILPIPWIRCTYVSCFAAQCFIPEERLDSLPCDWYG